MGKLSLIFKCLGIPQLICSSLIWSVANKTSVKLITNQVPNFLWNKHPDKIKTQVMYQDYSEGGLHIPNIQVTFKSLNLAWIPRLLTSEDFPIQSWAHIANYYFK